MCQVSLASVHRVLGGSGERSVWQLQASGLRSWSSWELRACSLLRGQLDPSQNAVRKQQKRKMMFQRAGAQQKRGGEAWQEECHTWVRRAVSSIESSGQLCFSLWAQVWAKKWKELTLLRAQQARALVTAVGFMQVRSGQVVAVPTQEWATVLHIHQPSACIPNIYLHVCTQRKHRC